MGLIGNSSHAHEGVREMSIAGRRRPYPTSHRHRLCAGVLGVLWGSRAPQRCWSGYAPRCRKTNNTISIATKRRSFYGTFCALKLHDPTKKVRSHLPHLTFLVGDTTDNYGKFTVNQSVDVKALGILPNQRQTCVGGGVVGEFFDNKVGHMVLAFWAKTISHLSR